MASSRYPNARVTLVHLRGAETAGHFLIALDSPGARVGVRVHVRLPDGTWADGVIDDRPESCPGSPIMVTLDR